MKTTSQPKLPARLFDLLPAAGRSPEIPADDDLYGWLVGSWELDLRIHDADGSIRESRGEAHAAWVLQGRAVQDVFIHPRRTERDPALPKLGTNWYGSTFRMYDPAVRAWRVTWLNPINASSAVLVARRHGPGIVQEGTYSDGGVIRWTFSEMTPTSFHWLAERREGDGKSWIVQVEFQARRI